MLLQFKKKILGKNVGNLKIFLKSLLIDIGI